MRILLRDLSPNTSYNLQLRANDGAGNVSEWSRIFNLTTTGDAVAPKTPTGLAVVPSGTSFAISFNAVTLSEDDSASHDLKEYYVKVQNSALTETRTFAIVDNKMEFTFEDNASTFPSGPQGTIKVSVAAGDNAGNVSAYSSIVTAVNPGPSPVTGLTATAQTDSIGVKWDANTADLDLKGYQVWVSTTGSGGTYSKVWSGVSTSYVHQSTLYTTDHWFRVYSVDVFNTLSTAAQTGSAVRPNSSFAVDSTAPAVPTGLTATMTTTADATSASAAVSWTAVTDTDGDLAGYRIGYRTVGASDWQYEDVDYTLTSTRIDRLIPYVNYEFRIRSYDWSANYSAWSSTATGTANSNSAPSTPAAPTAASAVQRIQVTVTGNKAAGGAMEADVTAYEIYASTSTGFTPSTTTMLGTIDVGPAMIGSWQVPASGSGTTETWYVKIIAVDRGGLKSAASAQTTATPNLILTANIGDAQITNAKIGSLAADKITAGSGIINDITVKSKLTLGDASTTGSIESFGYVAGTTGFHLDKTTLEINQGSIAAAALKIQNSFNLVPAEHASFEFVPSFYAAALSGTSSTRTIVESGGKYGSQYLQVRSTSAAAFYTYLAPSSTSYNIDVEEGKTYIVSIWTKTGTVASNITLGANYNVGSPSNAGSVSLSASGAWQRLSGTITAPAGSSKMLVTVLTNTATTGAGFDIDGVQVEEKIGALTTPSVWKMPGVTRIDAGIIRTGELRSTSDITIGGLPQPAWSINMSGNAQFGNALIRGNMIVGSPLDPTDMPNRIVNPDFEVNASNVSVYQWFTGTGNTTVTLSRTTTGGEVITGTGSLKLLTTIPNIANGHRTALGVNATLSRDVFAGDTVVYSVSAKVTGGTLGGLRVGFNNPAADGEFYSFHDSTTVLEPESGTTYTYTGQFTTTEQMPVGGTDEITFMFFNEAPDTLTEIYLDDIDVQMTSDNAISSVYSYNYTQGVTGWKIDSSGSVEFNSGVFRGTLGLNTVTSSTLSSTIILNSKIASANTGKRWELDSEGFRLFDIDDSIIINLPTDPDAPSSFSGDLLASSLTISDQFALRGSQNEISRGSILKLATGTTEPAAAPVVTIDWPVISIPVTEGDLFDFPASRVGLAMSGGKFYMAQKIWNQPSKVSVYSSTGEYLSAENIHTVGMNAYGLTILGNVVYVIGDVRYEHGNEDIYVDGYDLTTKARVAHWRFGSPMAAIGMTKPPIVGHNGTNLLVATTDIVNGPQNTVGFWTCNPTTGAAVVGYTSTGWPTAGTLTSVYVSNFDVGASRFMMSFSDRTEMYAMNPSGWARTIDDEFPLPLGNTVGTDGAFWDGTNWYTVRHGAEEVYKHTNIKWASPESSTWWVSNTWYDENTTGGTHETVQGPKRMITMKKRARLNITTTEFPPRPVPNTDDDATSTNIYIGRGATSPLAVNTERQITASTSRVNSLIAVTLPTGGNSATVIPPGVTNFPETSPASIMSADETTFIVNGDGSGQWGGIVVDSSGNTTIDDGNWTAFAPTWTQSDGAGLSIGNGTLVGFYKKIGKTVHFRITLTRGSTTNVGSVGYYRWQLPFSCVFPQAGDGVLNRGGTISALSTLQVNEDFVFAQLTSNNTRLGFNNPGSWAAGDFISLSFTFEAE